MKHTVSAPTFDLLKQQDTERVIVNGRIEGGSFDIDETYALSGDATEADLDLDLQEDAVEALEKLGVPFDQDATVQLAFHKDGDDEDTLPDAWAEVMFDEFAEGDPPVTFGMDLVLEDYQP